MICTTKSCTESAEYNFQNINFAEYCTNHKTDGMVKILPVNVFSQMSHQQLISYISENYDEYICSSKNCTNDAIFNYADSAIPSKCNDHKKENMINKVFNLCIVPGCTNRPRYFVSEEYPRILCDAHCASSQKLKKLQKRKCNVNGCDVKDAIYNDSLCDFGLYCKTCKDPSMINVVSHICKMPNCKNRGNNKCEETGNEYCDEHTNMIQKKIIRGRTNLCKNKDCETHGIAYYGLFGGKAEFCKKCIPENMQNEYVNVTHIICKEINKKTEKPCTERATHATLGTRKLIACKDCASDMMYKVSKKKQEK